MSCARLVADGGLPRQVAGQPLHESAEAVDTFFSRVDTIWQQAVAECRKPLEGKTEDGHNIVLVTHGSVRPPPEAAARRASACDRPAPAARGE